MKTKDWLILGAVGAIVGVAFGCSSGSSGGNGSPDGGGSSSGTSSSSGAGSSGAGSSGIGSSSGTSSSGAGSSGASSSGSGSSSGSDAGGDGGTPSCAAYCGLMGTNCTGANQQYIDANACMAVCATFMPGMEGDMSGDTLGCRETHAGYAAMNATVHCPHASLLGGMTCAVDNCTSFCEVDLAICTGNLAAYQNMNDCKTACANFPYTAGESITADESKNTLNCRVYHLQAASEGGAALTTHCPHTKQVSAVCNQ